MSGSDRLTDEQLTQLEVWAEDLHFAVGRCTQSGGIVTFHPDVRKTLELNVEALIDEVRRARTIAPKLRRQADHLYLHDLPGEVANRVIADRVDLILAGADPLA